MYDKLLKPRQSLRITLYINNQHSTFQSLWCILFTKFLPTYFGNWCSHLQGDVTITRIRRYKCGVVFRLSSKHVQYTVYTSPKSWVKAHHFTMSSIIPRARARAHTHTHTHTHTHNDFKSQDFNHYPFLTYICITYIILTDHIITFNCYGVTVTQLTTFVCSYCCNNKKTWRWPQKWPKYVGENLLNNIPHKHWCVFCWLFIYYVGELMSGNQEDGAKWGLSLTKINYNYAQKKGEAGWGAYMFYEAATGR